MSSEEILPVEQVDRNFAAELCRVGGPGIGNGNKVIANEIKGKMHDDYGIVKAARDYRTTAEQRGKEEAARIAEACAHRLNDSVLLGWAVTNGRIDQCHSIAAAIRESL